MRHFWSRDPYTLCTGGPGALTRPERRPWALAVDRLWQWNQSEGETKTLAEDCGPPDGLLESWNCLHGRRFQNSGKHSLNPPGEEKWRHCQLQEESRRRDSISGKWRVDCPACREPETRFISICHDRHLSAMSLWNFCRIMGWGWSKGSQRS